MRPSIRAAGIGMRRGWHEFVIGLRSPSDQGFYIGMGAGAVALLWFADGPLEGTALTAPQVALPGLLAGILVFTIVIGPAYALALEREDGTLLRSRMAPHGLVGYLTGVATLTVVSLAPLLVVVLGGTALLLPGTIPGGAGRWLVLILTALLGILASLPLGFVIGSVVRRLQQVTTWGMLPIVGLAWISGIFGSMDDLWGWVQGLAQMFPLYWLGHLMRAVLLGDPAVGGELGGEWRIALGIAVLLAWAVIGTGLAGLLVRRMARRQSGAAVAEAREQSAMQFVR
ncbi:ABC transporter permease [Euzebya tangerina]|uniref:ABC transporter permease n=1 Tax=Euzebya tangerina TaxID=591198 RepID=UPI000E31B250|nr:ABC transporter permease [Euzebya tangerina]